MPIQYKPFSPSGLKGFEQRQPTIIRPRYEHLATAAPNFTQVNNWPELPGEQQYTAPVRPGQTGSEYASMEQLGYAQFAQTPEGRGVDLSPIVVNDPSQFPYMQRDGGVRFGSADLSIIDPIAGFHKLTGEFIGQKQPLVGYGGSAADPFAWFTERDIDLANAPSRLFDYAFSAPVTWAQMLMGKQFGTEVAPREPSGEPFFPFEADPYYWQSLKDFNGTGVPPTDQQLEEIARAEAAQHSAYPEPLAAALFDRFKMGRDQIVTALSSGNERVDYIAQKQLQQVLDIIKAGATGTVDLGPFKLANDPVAAVQQLLAGTQSVAQSLVTMTPIVGTPMAETLMPVSQEAQDLWERLDPATRRQFLSNAVMTTMAVDVWSFFPFLSGAGAFAEILKAGGSGGEFMTWAAKANRLTSTGAWAGTRGGTYAARSLLNVSKEAVYSLGRQAPGIYRGYAGTMHVVNRGMAIGVMAMTANWALESLFPSYAESVGRAIDSSRPFSESSVAGAINFSGYFSSATLGAATAVRATAAVPRTVGKAFGKAGGILGSEESRVLKELGGYRNIDRSLRYYTKEDGSALTAAEFETPVKSNIVSGLHHFDLDGKIEQAIRVADDADGSLAHLPPEQRVQMANDILEGAGQHSGATAARLASLLQTAHEARSFLGEFTLTDAQRLIHNTIKKNVRDIEDAIAEKFARLYSETWWLRQFRRQGIAYDRKRPAEAYAAWLKKEAARKGLQLDLAGLRSELGKSGDDWRRFANLQHAHEYHLRNAEMLEAARMSPEGVLAHPDDMVLMRNDHLFQDRIDLFRAAKDQMGTDAAVLSEQGVREMAADLVNGTKEGEEWWARNGRGHATPDNIDLDAFSAFLDDIYSISARRHPVNVLGETAEFPINKLAHRLEQEGVFSVAYKPKENLVAHRPAPRAGSPNELATRVSQTTPDGYTLDPPVGIRAVLDDTADGLFHVTLDRDAVVAEGLRTRRELIAGSGDTLMFHGTSSQWFYYDPALAKPKLLMGKGLYLTNSHRTGVGYAEGVLKEMRVPGDAKIFDAHGPIPQDVTNAIHADLQNPKGRFFAAADRAARDSGDMFDPADMLAPGGNWYEALNELAVGRFTDPASKVGYFEAVQGTSTTKALMNVEYVHLFKDAFNDVLYDAGYEGLSHIGGLVAGAGKNLHDVIVLFDPTMTLSRAKAIGTGAGGGIEDAGRQVSFVTNSALANVIEERLRLAVRAARGEASVDEVMDHFIKARESTGATDHMDLWDAVARANPSETPLGSALDAAIADVTGQRPQAYWSPKDQPEMMEVLRRFYDPDLNGTIRTGAAAVGREQAPAELVILLDSVLEKGNPLRKPMDANFTYDPNGWGRYRVGINQSPAQLAKMDPAKVGQVRVARRMEPAYTQEAGPRVLPDEIGDLQEGWAKVQGNEDVASQHLYKQLDVSDPKVLDDLIDNGMRPELYGTMPGNTISPIRLLSHTATPEPAASGTALFRIRHTREGYLNAYSDSAGGRLIDETIPADLIEVWTKDGWRNLGRMDRHPQDPTPHETLSAWQERLWEGVVHEGTPIEKRDSQFVMMSGSMYDEGMRTGNFQPATAYDDTVAFDWDAFLDWTPQRAIDTPYVVEFDGALANTQPMAFNTTAGRSSFLDAPKQSVRRVWLWSDERNGFMLHYERGKSALGESDFYNFGSQAGELRANSNHLWTVDEQAAAKWGGWRDTEPVPLDNAWEQPWASQIEDATEPIAEAATYRHVSFVRTRDGQLLKAPWVDYPQNAGDIYLGNRSFLGNKFDSVFMGFRSWKMHDYQLAQATRILGGDYGFSGAQVESFKAKVDLMARSEKGWSPFGKYGRIRVTPYATVKFRSDEVQKVGEQIFGSEPILNRSTGKLEVPDYARLLGDAYQQAWTLNLTSGITSRIKQFDHLGIGPLSTAIADWFVPLIRYKASVIFRTSELVESGGFNVVRQVRVEPEERAAFVEAGLAPKRNMLAGEFGTEPMMESLFTPSQSRTEAALAGINDIADLQNGTGPSAGYALWRRVDDLFTRKGVRGLLDDIKDPAPYKNGQMLDMQIQIVERELPGLIKEVDPIAYKVLREELHVPDELMARFIVEDRVLFQKWQRGEVSFEELTAHANQFTPGKAADSFDRLVSAEDMAKMKEIYATEDWAALEVLMRASSLSAQMESFGVHFFGSYRSALERSINHPLLGIYPASWALKAAREWVRFMYDNRVFGNGTLRLGMFPAVATREIQNKINIAVAQNTNEKWEDWLNNGPAANWLFLWNLMLPGDWGSLPLPLSRPIRSVARALMSGDYERLQPLALTTDAFFGPNSRGGMGAIRDINLATRGIEDIYNALAGDSKDNEWQNLMEGLSLNGIQRQPVEYRDLVTMPYRLTP